MHSITPDVFYNARLLDVVLADPKADSSDEPTDQLVFDHQGNTLQLLTFAGSAKRCAMAKAEGKPLPEIGQIGAVMRTRTTNALYSFRPYVDQTLRRAFELDVFEHMPPIGSPRYNAERIGWRNESNIDGFLAPAGIIPGEDGRFIADMTEGLELDVPPEFIELCEQFEQTPEQVLRGFIADAAGLANYVSEPRADGYDSNGSDERDMAAAYLERAYGTFR